MQYRSFNAEMRSRFGCKVYKLSVDGGMTCPTRDGTLGTGGCIFCSSTGSGEFAAAACGSVEAQIRKARELVAHKNRDGKYIVYFQNHTNTYAPVSYLEPLFREAIGQEDVVALSIATRPDCIAPEIVEMLVRLNEQKPVWIELGLQTIHAETAAYIRRGYPLEVYDDAVRILTQAGIEVITHVILGLPGETREDMLETVRYVGHSGASGIKLQLLHVLKDTDLEKDWRQGRVPVMELDEYVSLLEACIRNLPPEMVIHRLTGDGDKRILLAPLWSGNKKVVLNTINQMFALHHVEQGSEWKTIQKQSV